mmetsp:Transcript_12167/g.17331  ORF Transcript_12167/g.17331 Transcript_12167/m.17331 type:complete len:338 (-) Transcript_12167:134-1147(-)
MSAYALPGRLFLPSPGSSSALTNQGSSSSSKTSSSTSGPLHAQNHGNETSTKQDRKNSGFGIAVKDARIDPVRLLASNTSSKKISSSFFSTTSSSDVKPKNDDSFDAIQFELSISFSGRTYTATRTLPRIMQLRDELINEMNAQRNRWNNRHYQRRRHQQQQNQRQDDDEEKKSDNSDDNNSCNNSNKDSDEENEEEITIPVLPECSQETAENGTMSCGGIGARGFTMLQALVRNYCPVVEGWLLNVADIVHPNSSQSLTNFLWEPLDNSYDSNTGNSIATTDTNTKKSLNNVKDKRDEMSKRDRRTKFYRYSASNSSSTLASIDEAEDCNGSDDEL